MPSKLTFSDPPETEIEWGLPLGAKFDPALKTAKHELFEAWSSFSAHYGFAVLMLEGLYTSVVQALYWHHFRRLLRKQKHRDLNELLRLPFEQAINYLTDFLPHDASDTRNLISELHFARKLRNKIVHRAFVSETIDYFKTPGGVSKLTDQLKTSINRVYGVAGIMESVAKAYAADCGVTSELELFLESLPPGKQTEALTSFWAMPESEREAWIRKMKDTVRARTEAGNNRKRDLGDFTDS